jgi:REP element-mobilizing transposase RayT
MSETRPTRVQAEDTAPQLESDSASYFDITYACMLIPRLSEHHLVGDLAKQLEKWMFQICVSFDWRVGPLAIRPDYMQWMVKAHAATAPRFLMQIITRITSQRIFAHFGHLAADNPSGEFWAPGWLVITSESLPTSQMSQDFVTKTRRRQGL